MFYKLPPQVSKILGLILCFYAIMNTCMAQHPNEHQALETALQFAPKEEKASLYNQLGWQLLGLNDEKALAYYMKALAFLSSKTPSKELAKTYHGLGYYFLDKENFDSAQYYYHLAIPIFIQTQADSLAAKSYLSLGVSYDIQSDHEKAILYYTKSLRIFEQQQDEENSSHLLNNIGIVYFSLEDYEKALYYYQKSLALRVKSKNYKYIAASYNNIGATYKLLGAPDKAITYYTASLALKDSLGDLPGKASTYHNIALIHESKEEYEKAYAYLQKTLAIELSLGEMFAVSTTYITLAENAYHQKAYKESKAYAEKALAISEELGFPSNAKRSYHVLQLQAEAGHQYKEALQYANKVMELQDSIFSEAKNKQILEITAKYEVEKKDKELTKLTLSEKNQQILIKEQQLIASQQQFQRNTAIWIASILLFISIFFYWQYQQKQRNNKVLAEKNNIIEQNLKEKEMLLQEIHHRVKNNLQLISSILRLQSYQLQHQDLSNILQDTQHRINSISMIHNKLYQPDTIQGLDMKAYLEELVGELTQAYSNQAIPVKVQIKSSNSYLSIGTSIYIGLLVTELVTNAFKYAFPSSIESPQLSITFKDMGNILYLRVSDNGPGISLETSNKTSFGWQMVNMLAQQLGATIEINNKKGTSIDLNIHQFKRYED